MPGRQQVYGQHEVQEGGYGKLEDFFLGIGRLLIYLLFFFSSRRRHTRFDCDWSSDVCSSDLRRFQHAILGLSRQKARTRAPPSSKQSTSSAPQAPFVPFKTALGTRKSSPGT